MLVLSRRRDEGVTIGPDIRVVVLGIKGGVVSLGIEAPPQIAIHRDEVSARVQAQNRLAANAQALPLGVVDLLKKPMGPTTLGGRTLS
jgi:carbon storage regulator